jgi:hypothetical protein
VPHLRAQAGYALPLALILGVAMTGVALTILARSRTTSLTAQSQSRSAESLLAAEGGIDRTYALLSQFAFSSLLRVNHDPDGLLGPAEAGWFAEGTRPLCYTDAGLEAALLSGSAGSGSYDVLAYRYDDVTQEGTLMVQGNQGTAISQVVQSVDVEPDPATFPGLLGTIVVDLGNNDVIGVDGNVVCSDRTECEVVCTTPNTAPTDQSLRDAVGAKANSVVSGEIYVGELELPPIPPRPNPMPYLLGVINNNLTLPRPGDTPPYIYNVSSINLSGNSVLTVDATTEPVTFYMDGNIRVSGTTEIRTVAGAPLANFRIYGDTIATNTITLNGSTCIEAFIYAPNASMGISGGGSCSPFNVDGAVWVKEWQGSDSNVANVHVPPGTAQAVSDALGGVQITSFTNRLTGINTWTRVEARLP